MAHDWKAICTDVSRDPVQLIQALLDSPEPLAPVLRAMERIMALARGATAGSKEEAVARRNELLLGVLLSNPLRRKNIVALTYKADITGSVFRTGVGEWRIRIASRDFKNGKKRGAAHRYDVAIGFELGVFITGGKTLDVLEYLFGQLCCGYPLRAIDPKASQAQGKAVRLDSFVPGSRFEDVVRLYVFDKKLRLLALDALERIEMAVRVDVAHLLGQRDPGAHENPACLHGNFAKKQISKGPNAGKTEHQLWLAKYHALLHRARKDPFVLHHLQQYGALPIWVAVEVWDFGLLSKLFAGMQHADQQHIAGIYGAPSGQDFAKWLRSLNFIRNVSAHHSRLWNLNVGRTCRSSRALAH